MRFALSVAAAVREGGGPGQAVVFRMSGASFVEGGSSADEVLEFARRLASGGAVDALNVGIGWHESRVPTVQALVPHGRLASVGAGGQGGGRRRGSGDRVEPNQHGRARRGGARRPATQTSCRWPARSWRIRRSCEGDGCGLGSAVNVCIACNQACIDRSIFDRRVSCVVNPRAGYELELGLPGGEAGVAGAGRGRGRRSRRHGGGARTGGRRARGVAVRSLRSPRRPVPDGVPDPGQGGLRADDRVFRGRARAAGGGGCAGRAGARRRPARGSTAWSSPPACCPARSTSPAPICRTSSATPSCCSATASRRATPSRSSAPAESASTSRT